MKIAMLVLFSVMMAPLASLFSFQRDKPAEVDRAWRWSMMAQIRRLWVEEHGQDIAEYAVMLAVILVLVVGTIRLIGSNANNAFSTVASTLQ